MRILRMRILHTILAVTICFAVYSPSLAESRIIPIGVPNLTKSDFSITLYECTSSGGCSTVDSSSVAIVELANERDYLVSSLPDPVAGSGTWYELTMFPNGVLVSYVYPIQTRTPQSTSSVVSYRVPSIVTLASGDTLPNVQVTIAGLSSDPSGAAVTFNLWSVSTGAKVLDNVSATISDIDAQSDGTWTATLQHQWLVAETSNLSGFYYGRFNITFSGGGVMTVPPAPNNLRVQVHP